MVAILQRGHIIEDEGTALTQRPDLNFTGAGVTATDSGGKTVVDIPGGGGSGDVESVTAADASIVVSGTGTDPEIAAGSLDEIASLHPPIADVPMNNQKLTQLAPPTLDLDAATKAYVDAIAAGVDVKESVVAATTANITLSGAQTIDGISIVATNRVLVKNQTAPAENGIYDAAAGAWARSADADTDAEVTAGMFTFVESGTVHNDQGWVLATNNPIVVGTTPLTFTQYSGAGAAPSDAEITFTDITTNNASTTKHGFLPKLSNSPTSFLNGQGAWATPSGVKGFKSVNDYGAVQNDSSAGAITANNAAIVAATAALVAEGGGILWFPGGITDVSGTRTAADKVHWKGAGRFETIVRWLTDTGVGTWGVVTSPVALSNAPFFEDMCFSGPAGAVTAGVAGCNMHGLKLSYKSSMRRCLVQRFNQGVTLIGDHNVFDDCRIAENYKGIEFPGSIWVSKGNQSFRDCDLTGNGLCGIHISGDNTMDNVLFTATHFGFGPFGILRTGAATAGMMIDCVFVGGAFEYIGNSCISDLATGGQPSWVNNVIDSPGYSSAGAPFYYSGLTKDYNINCPGGNQGGRIYNNLYQFLDGTLGAYNFALGGPTIYYGTAGNARFVGSLLWYDDQGSQHVNYAGGGETFTIGDLVEHKTGGITRATSPFHGIVGSVVAVNGTSWILVKTAGFTFSVLAETVAGGGVPLAQKTGTMYKVGPAASYPENPIIGYSRAAGGNAGGTALCLTRLVLPGPTLGGAQQTYTITNVTPDRSFDADTVLVAELADAFGTLVADLRARGILL